MAGPKTDFLALLETLTEHEVDFIIVGGVCGVLLGAPIATFDLDIVHSRQRANLQRLIQALDQLCARYREHPDKNLKPDLTALASAGHHLLITDNGPLDILGSIGEDADFDRLSAHTVDVALSEGARVRILDLDTLIAVKEQAGRDKDQAMLIILRRLRDELAQQWRKPSSAHGRSHDAQDE